MSSSSRLSGPAQALSRAHARWTEASGRPADPGVDIAKLEALMRGYVSRRDIKEARRILATLMGDAPLSWRLGLPTKDGRDELALMFGLKDQSLNRRMLSDHLGLKELTPDQDRALRAVAAGVAEVAQGLGERSYLLDRRRTLYILGAALIGAFSGGPAAVTVASKVVLGIIALAGAAQILLSCPTIIVALLTLAHGQSEKGPEKVG